MDCFIRGTRNKTRKCPGRVEAEAGVEAGGGVDLIADRTAAAG